MKAGFGDLPGKITDLKKALEPAYQVASVVQNGCKPIMPLRVSFFSPLSRMTQSVKVREVDPRQNATEFVMRFTVAPLVKIVIKKIPPEGLFGALERKIMDALGISALRDRVSNTMMAPMDRFKAPLDVLLNTLATADRTLDEVRLSSTTDMEHPVHDR